ncbi:MAG: coenzyme F420-0:L-glutamate ligase [Anaerolineales bacterium]|nr:coenzyme F420-0:L-glutamate ligase [Anaerolineales bacterium]
MAARTQGLELQALKTINPLTLTPLPGIPLIRAGDDLADIILGGLSKSQIKLKDGDILVLAQKIVSKSEGRWINLLTVFPSTQAIEAATRSEKDPRLVELILQESREILRVRPGTIVVEHKLGFVCANAGIDHSNVAAPETSEVFAKHPRRGQDFGSLPAEDWVLLLPENPDRSAVEIRHKLEAATGLKIGVLIVDSHGRAWRLGTVGMAIGLSGLPGLVDERGWKDLFGYTLQITVVGVADELAAAASLVMGQAAEGTPVVHVRGFPYPLCEGSLGELLRNREQDLFR